LERGWAKPWPGEDVLFDASSLPAARADGPVMAEVHDGSVSGVALVRPGNGAIVKMIESFSPVSQATGAYDGEYAVWKESHTTGSTDDFTVKEWAASTGAIRTVGGAHYGSHHQAIQSSVQDPVIAGDHAAWVESLRNDGSGEIVVLDLRTGQRTIVHRGHPGWIALTRTEVIWAESSAPGASTTIRALELSSGRSTAAPKPLAKARGAWGFVTDGSAWAWVGVGADTTVYGAAPGSARAVRVGSLSGGASPPLAIADGIATVPISSGGLMTIDLSTMASTDVSAASYAINDGPNRLEIMKLVTDKESNVRSIATVPSSDAALKC
jgi:hypothetical protein